MLTVDSFLPGWKPRDLQHAWQPFLEGTGIANYTSDPVFRSLLEKSPDEDPQAAVGQFVGQFSNPELDWDDLEFLRAETELPILIKGILHPDDARAARDREIDGVVVSNHGGRQIDGEIAALDALPAIADAVGDDIAVLCDSGIRGGADVVQGAGAGGRRDPARPSLPVGTGTRRRGRSARGSARGARRARPHRRAQRPHSDRRPPPGAAHQGGRGAGLSSPSGYRGGR